ncbi:leucine--tRNA ligase [Candidatus Saccharibacteria bacterium]|nr:leucine--tRNA ligase [Candidatus Saccharibacteria bacterium]
MRRYNPKEIEPFWQKFWQDNKTYHTSEDSTKPKRYVLEYFPYPSGAAMHVGHVRNYTIGDAISRFNRMRGHNVLHPMGWDAFGLPAENYAIKTGISPKQTIKDSTTKFKKQLMQMGFDYDWSREINSSDPDYYKWTQWFFLLLYRRGLAYRKESLQWWCPVDKTVLANEQVENGHCWRCDSIVEKKALPQWFFKITEYADRLIEDLEDLDWSDSIKSMQRNWIGKSKGAEVDFKIDGTGEKLTVFTTRPDTLFGATFMVLAPEHELVKKITTAEEKDEIEKYIKSAQAKSEIERQDTNREKTGVFTGAYAINPVNDTKIPIWIADYVLAGYGTGAIMAVPAHDERDNEFAKKYDLEIIEVVKTDEKSEIHSEGVIINSGKYNDLRSEQMREKIVNDLAKSKQGKEVINYKIRDWLISRQRYWGAPIPIIHCDKDGIVPVPEKDLPVVLPEIKSYEPSGDGRSPLANVEEFVNTTCPKCGGKATRETDTMDGFACSSWYFLRFADPHNSEKAFSDDKAKFWLPVDDYIGGAEHAVMHLLYARFWTKVMFDEGLVDFSEPFKSLRNQGMILAPDGNKMSKSKGNTIEPGGLIDQGYGADSIRLMELFIGPWNQAVNWSIDGIGGTFRFLQRVWVLNQEFIDSEEKGDGSDPEIIRATHKAIKKVSEDLADMQFNTAVAALMELTNELYKIKADKGFVAKAEWDFALMTLAQLLAPFAPHITEELWQDLGHKGSVHLSEWPVHDDKYLVSDTINIVVQVNGKLKANVKVSADSSEEEVVSSAKSDGKVAQSLDNKEIKKTIYIKGRLINFVVE